MEPRLTDSTLTPVLGWAPSPLHPTTLNPDPGSVFQVHVDQQAHQGLVPGVPVAGL